MRLLENPGSLLVGALAGGAVVAAAIFSFQLLVTDGNRVEPDSNSTTTDSTENPIGTVRQHIESLHEARHHFELLDAQNNFDGTHALYAALATAGKEDLQRLLEQSKTVASDSHRLVIQGSIFERFAALDPHEAIRQVKEVPWQHRNAVLTRIFKEWSTSNLEAAIASIADLGAKSQVVALRSILETRDDLPESRRKDIARNFDSEALAVRLINESRAFSFVDDPEAAWNALASGGFDVVSQLDLLTNIAEQWVEQSGIEVLSQVIETTIGDLGYNILIRRVIEVLTETNPREVFDFAVELDRDKQLYMVGRVSSVWAESDPLAATQALAELEPDTDAAINIQIVLHQWARTKPEEIFKNRALLPRDVQLQALEFAIAEFAKTNPQEAIQWLNELDADWDNTSVIARSMVNGWADVDPEAAVEWLNSESATFGSKYLTALGDVLVKLVHVSPQKAFDIALSQPLTNFGHGLEARLVEELSRTDLDAALAFLPQVRDESRRRAYSQVGDVLVRSGQSRRALELGSNLSESEGDEYYNGVIGRWARTDAEQLFEEMENLPSEDVKALAAYHLALAHERTPVLTKEQMDRARSYLNEEYEERLERWLQR